MNDDWIIIPNWDKFQHYGLYRRPLWIKNYTALLRKDEYLDLPLAARGLLHGIWLAYADSNGQLRRSDLPAYCRGRARDAHLTSLNHAGFIGFCASKPLPLDLNTKNTVTKPAKARDVPAKRRPDSRPVDNGVAEPLPNLPELIGAWLEQHQPRV